MLVFCDVVTIPIKPCQVAAWLWDQSKQGLGDQKYKAIHITINYRLMMQSTDQNGCEWRLPAT